jgi:hypothetical protein
MEQRPVIGFVFSIRSIMMSNLVTLNRSSSLNQSIGSNLYEVLRAGNDRGGWWPSRYGEDRSHS